MNNEHEFEKHNLFGKVVNYVANFPKLYEKPIKDEIIVNFYLIPEFYNKERINKFLNKINKEINKLIIIKEDNLNNFYIDSELIGYYIDWNIQKANIQAFWF